jgi:hypothetical protein
VGYNNCTVINFGFFFALENKQKLTSKVGYFSKNAETDDPIAPNIKFRFIKISYRVTYIQ